MENLFTETSRQSSNSIVLNVEDGGNSIKTQDSYTATGILKNVGNVTDKSTFITTYQPHGNTSISTGNGIIMTTDDEIATYTGHYLGITDKNGTQTYHDIQIFQTNSDEKLVFLDNLIGLYEYKYWSNGINLVSFGNGNKIKNNHYVTYNFCNCLIFFYFLLY